MKKFLLFLTLLVSAIGLTHAAETQSFTISFVSSKSTTALTKDNFITTGIVAECQKYVSSCDEINTVYPNIRLGNGTNPGSVTFSLAEAYQVYATEIVVNAETYNTDASTINVNRLGAKALSAEATDYKFTLSGTEKLTSITLATGGSNAKKSRGYVYSVTVYYKDGTSGGEGPTLTDPEINWTLDGEPPLAEGALVEATLDSDSNVFPTLAFADGAGDHVTCSSSNKDVATVDNNGKVTIIAAGTTTITASTRANDATYKQASKSYTLKVIDPNAIIDSFGYGDLTFTESNKYWSFSYTNTTSGAEYAGYAYTATNNTKIQIKQTDNNGLYVSKVPANLKISKIIITTSDSNAKAKITVYGNTTAFEATGTTGSSELGSLTGNGTLTINFNDNTNEALYGKAFNAFCVNAVASNTVYISSVEVVWEPLQEGDIKAEPGLAYAETEVEKTMDDETIIFTNPLTNLHSLPITYSIDPADSPVATVDANGQVTVKAAGTVKIVASFAGNETYKAGSASYTLKVVDTKLYDTFDASNLIFDEGSGYRNFTYTAEKSGAVYGGFADANESTLMIQNQASGKSGIFVSKAPAGYKLHTITVTTATGSADLTLYGSTKPYASVSTDGKSIGTFEGGNKDYIYVNGYEGDIAAYGIIPTTFSICGADKASSVTEITVIWELDTRKDAELAYATTEVTLAEGETLTQPTLNKPDGLPVTYSTDNAEVATVAEDGKITLVEGGIGTAVITAYTDGNASYKPASATFTITVKKAKVAYLVTDASVLQPGDIVIIANQEYGKAMSTEANTNNRKTTTVTFNTDFSEITSIPDDALLLKLGSYTNDKGNTFWTFTTTNYANDKDKDGYLYCASSGTSYRLYVGSTLGTVSSATISTTSKGVATILFLEGKPNSTTPNRVRFNYNKGGTPLFSCYASDSEQDDVYIYKVVDKPATVGVQTQDCSFAAKGEKENLNVIELQNYFTTTTSASKVAIYLENVLVGTYDVDASGYVYANLDYIPYLPTAKFTMRPVLATDAEGNPTQVGPAEALEFTWPAIKDDQTVGFGLVDEAILCVNEADQDGPWNLYGQFTFLDDFKVENLDYYVEVTAVKNEYDELPSEFAWGNGGFIVTIPDFFSSWTWDTNTGHPDITKCTVPVVTFFIISSYEFTYDTKYSTLVTAPAGAPARLAAPGETATQKVTGIAQELKSTLSNETMVSGVEGVTVDGGAAVEYFNLQGVRVDGALTPGIYIRRQGQAVSKVRIN